MRAVSVPDRNETRDAIDQRWASLLAQCGALPLFLPNVPGLATEMLNRTDPHAVVLTGGDDIVAVSGMGTARDAVEQEMIEWALREGRPLLGVCRGLQALTVHFGGALAPVEGHVGQPHPLISGRVVNSFHNYRVDRLPPNAEVLERALDGCIEAFLLTDAKSLGLMWHPERTQPFDQADLRLIRDHFMRSP